MVKLLKVTMMARGLVSLCTADTRDGGARAGAAGDADRDADGLAFGSREGSGAADALGEEEVPGDRYKLAKVTVRALPSGCTRAPHTAPRAPVEPRGRVTVACHGKRHKAHSAKHKGAIRARAQNEHKSQNAQHVTAAQHNLVPHCRYSTPRKARRAGRTRGRR